MSADETQGFVPGAAETAGAAETGAAAAVPPGARLATWARLLAVDIAVGLMWALLLAAAILFISGVSQFIYVDF